MYREIIINEEIKYYLVLYNVYVLVVLKVLYNDIGYYGKKIFLLIKDRFYWVCIVMWRYGLLSVGDVLGEKY